jgi:hypothetical protein
MLRSFDVGPLLDPSLFGLSGFLILRRLVRRTERGSFMRVPLARPLWYLGARLLGVPDASTHYQQFRPTPLPDGKPSCSATGQVQMIVPDLPPFPNKLPVAVEVKAVLPLRPEAKLLYGLSTLQHV